MRLTVSLIFSGIGLFFWIWGTLWLPGRKTLLWKIHALGISDSLGSALIIIGLLIRSPENWAALTLALISVIFWGTSFGFVIARGTGSRR